MIVVNAVESWTVTLGAWFSVLNYIDAYFSLRKKKMLSRSAISCTFELCVYFYSEKDLVLDGVSLILPVHYRLNDRNDYLLDYRLAPKAYKHLYLFPLL